MLGLTKAWYGDYSGNVVPFNAGGGGVDVHDIIGVHASSFYSTLIADGLIETTTTKVPLSLFGILLAANNNNSWGPRIVVYSNGYLYICTASEGIHIYDITVAQTGYDISANAAFYDYHINFYPNKTVSVDRTYSSGSTYIFYTLT